MTHYTTKHIQENLCVLYLNLYTKLHNFHLHLQNWVHQGPKTHNPLWIHPSNWKRKCKNFTKIQSLKIIGCNLEWERASQLRWQEHRTLSKQKREPRGTDRKTPKACTLGTSQSFVFPSKNFDTFGSSFQVTQITFNLVYH